MNVIEHMTEVTNNRNQFRKQIQKQNLDDIQKEELLKFDGMNEDTFYRFLTGYGRDEHSDIKKGVVDILYKKYSKGCEDPWARYMK